MYSGPGKLIYKNKIDTETQSLNFDNDSGNKAVKTQEKGYAGHARGAKMVSMSWDYAIPETGAYIDWEAICDSQKEITLTVQFATKQYVVKGNVTKAGLKSSAEGECNGSASFEGKIISRSNAPVVPS